MSSKKAQMSKRKSEALLFRILVSASLLAGEYNVLFFAIKNENVLYLLPALILAILCALSLPNAASRELISYREYGLMFTFAISVQASFLFITSPTWLTDRLSATVSALLFSVAIISTAEIMQWKKALVAKENIS